MSTSSPDRITETSCISASEVDNKKSVQEGHSKAVMNTELNSDINSSSNNSNNKTGCNVNSVVHDDNNDNSAITIIKGNIVTQGAVLYGGHVIVMHDRIVAVADNTTQLPTVEQLRRQFHHFTEVNVIDGGFVIPGFVDIHNHGLGGHSDVIGHWSNPSYSLHELARCGTLTTLASLIFSKEHELLVNKCIKAVEECIHAPIKPDCCELAGIHAEGPIIHDRGGLPGCNTKWSLPAFDSLCKSMPSMKIMTISPHMEAECDYAHIRYLLSHHIRPALGHDRVATKQEILAALQLATSEEDKLHLTHMCNVMTFHHRNASLLNIGLCRRFPQAPIYHNAIPPTLEIITDLIHCDAVTVQAVLCSRSTTDVAIITDCISAYQPGKRLCYNRRESVVRAEGGCYLCDVHGRPSNTLAGSTSTLADLFYNLITLFRVGLVEACQHTATVPARIARLPHVGSIEVGKRAHLLLLNTELNTIEKRMIAGKWATHRPYRMLRPSTSHM